MEFRKNSQFDFWGPIMKRSVTLVVGGSIAAYKMLEWCRLATRAGIDITPIMTHGAEAFITPISLASVTGCPVRLELFDGEKEGSFDHIRLSRVADLILVAPATANLLARMATGQADDLATTLLLATDAPVMVAPAMNVRMWLHAATQRNVDRLRSDGIEYIGPDDGDMACGEFGPGRMAEPAVILEAVERRLATVPYKTRVHLAASESAGTGEFEHIKKVEGKAASKLKGRHILITAGPTREALDPVRYLTNRSSGRQGYALAIAARNAGANVTLVSGPVSLPEPERISVIRVESAREMLVACRESLPADVVVCVAAVADVRPNVVEAKKIKKNSGRPLLGQIEWVENPDILQEISKPSADRPSLVIGFSAETQQVEKETKIKKSRKGCDWMFGNNVSLGSSSTFGNEQTQLCFIDEQGKANWFDRERKEDTSIRIVDLIIEYFASRSQEGKRNTE